MKLNKIMKKTILATMAVLMATSLSFTGCSNGDDDPTPGSTPTGDQGTIISRKSGQKIQKIANLQYYKSKANYGTKKKGISR